MQILETRSKYSFIIEYDVKEFMKYIDLGTDIPILPEFRKYLIRSFKIYKSKAILLKKNIHDNIFNNNKGEIEGITIIFNEDPEILFFGFFGVYNHDYYKIDLMIKNLINYAKKNNFRKIRGPVNIPAVIFGFGFMEEGSSKIPFVGCPVNPPIYQKKFYENKFYSKYIEDTYKMAAFKVDPRKIPKYDFSDYEVKFPGKENIWKVMDEMIALHSSVMPEYSNITPNTIKNVQTLFDYIFEFGEEWMVWTLHYKPSGKMIGCGHAAPNPLSMDRRGRYDTARFLHWVVEKKHQKKGLTVLMYGSVSLEAFKNTSRTKLKYGNGPFGIKNEANIGFAKNKTMGVRTRRHIILEKMI
ncbi:MAG: hypothetical protein GF317_19765 [Candidatus Lokiarchaeota archaeon]|nr:hypothetical protein [Candidatus Lokiarchaeota archaeon]MBD3201732.1 hypothetical protein [Candidatus Lokiarchaeota archaeon]